MDGGGGLLFPSAGRLGSMRRQPQVASECKTVFVFLQYTVIDLRYTRWTKLIVPTLFPMSWRAKSIRSEKSWIGWRNAGTSYSDPTAPRRNSGTWICDASLPHFPLSRPRTSNEGCVLENRRTSGLVEATIHTSLDISCAVHRKPERHFGEKPSGGDRYVLSNHPMWRRECVRVLKRRSNCPALCQSPMRDCFCLSSHPQACLTALRFNEFRLPPGTRDNTGRGIHMIGSSVMIHILCPC